MLLSEIPPPYMYSCTKTALCRQRSPHVYATCTHAQSAHSRPSRPYITISFGCVHSSRKNDTTALQCRGGSLVFHSFTVTIIIRLTISCVLFTNNNHFMCMSR